MAKFIKWLMISVGVVVVLAFIISLIAAFKLTSDFKNIVDKIKAVDFETCAVLGNPVMESYPRQCKAGDQTFIEDIGNTVEKMDLIKLTAPKPNDTVNSPLAIEGVARGTWFFEASFPVKLWDINGKEIAVGIAQTEEEWMTEDFVPFKTTLEFETPAIKRGLLILEKNNPSGLTENSDSLRIPIRFVE